MKRIRHYLRFALLMSMLLATASPALADWTIETKVNGCYYTTHIEGLGPDAVATYSTCYYADPEIKNAVVKSSLTVTIEWEEWESDGEIWRPVMKSRNLSAPVTEIAWWAFWECDSLISVTIPSTVTYIGGNAFLDCVTLKKVTIPNSVTEIRESTFSGSGLTDFTIGNSVTTIGNSAFGYCRDLANVTIGNSVTTIGNSAFYDCSNLRSVSIPRSVKTIGAGAFQSCTGLRDIYSQIMNPADVELGWGVFLDVATDTCVLHVPYGTEDLYRDADQWKDFFILGTTEMKTAFGKGFKDTFPVDEPKGVTADGASRMYIYFDEDISSVKSVTKVIKIDGQEVTDPAIIGDFGTFKKLPNGKYGFDYCAPVDFPEGYSTSNELDVTVEVRVTNSQNKEIIGYKKFRVMRPGVLLVHGVLANGETFALQKGHLMIAGGYRDYQVLNASYPASNTASFSDNTYVHQVVQNNLEALYDKLAKYGIVSSKYDLVGHSMGGVLSRIYAQEINPDAVNRIITLDSPHHGSQLANTYKPALYALLAGSYLPNPFVNKACKLLYAYFSSPDFAAFGDLAPASNATQKLNSKTCAGIPVHAIGSYMKESTHFEVVGHYAMNGDGLFYNYIFSIPNYQVVEDDHLGFELMDWFYDGENDGVVSLSSQLGGLSGAHKTEQSDTYLGVLGYKSNAHHTKTHHWDVTLNAITGFLKRPKKDPCFTTSGFRAPANALLESGGPSLVSMPVFKDAPENSFINLSLEKNEDEYDRDLVATVATSDDIESFFIFACLGEDRYLVSASWETEPTFVIPDNYEGNLVFYALGRTANDELVADIDSVEYTGITSLIALDFEEYDDMIMHVGQTLGFNVIATWANDEEEYVEPVFTASPSGILDIDGQMITPVAVGECDLVAEYKGFTCTKKIIVLPGDVPIEPLKGDVNLDGEVNIADINAAIGIILGGTQDLAGDVNGDGEVNIADVNAVIDIIFN